jgi:hypothetical protein
VTSIVHCNLPPDALLLNYQRPGTYTDCYAARIDSGVSAEVYFRAFLTSWLFSVERRILAVAISKPSTDAQAAELAAGRTDTFSAWRVEARTEAQLLLADFRGNTRSWLMAAEESTYDREITGLYFGSAILPRSDPGTGDERISAGFRAILGFHKLYARALLGAAARSLR